MNLSNELIAYIGALLHLHANNLPDGPRYDRARAMQLEWVQAIESAYREAEQRERDMETMPSLLTRRQAG